MKGSKVMFRYFCVFALLSIVSALLLPALARAQEFPIMDRVADKVIQRYQNSTCEQLWQKKGKPKGGDGAESRPTPEERPTDARCVHRQSSGSHRQQNVRMRHDSINVAGLPLRFDSWLPENSINSHVGRRNLCCAGPGIRRGRARHA